MKIRTMPTLAALACCLALAAGCDNADSTAGNGATGYESSESAQAQQPAQQPARRKSYDRPPEMSIDPAKTYTATIQTNRGTIKAELFDDAAPKTVNNFVFLAREKFYDGTIFHRVIDDFMLQGGDPTGTGMGGPGYTIPDEVRGNPHKHEPFVLSMAKTRAPDSGGSQFFVMESQPAPHLDGVHTVFGRVIEGQDVVSQIASTPVDANDRPTQDVIIEKVTIDESAGGATKPATRPSGQ